VNISLTPELENEITRRVASGRYGSASEVVREALRLLLEADELRALRKERLKAELEVGMADIEGGRVGRLDDALMDRIKAEGRARRGA
jgi:antitoxin ParD1/3/4